MKKFILLCVISISAAALFAKSDIKSNIVFDGAKIVLVGDSITHGGHYQKYLASYYATRFPEIRLEFVNRGINGNQCSNILARMDDEILTERADIFTLMTGMNDVGRMYFTKAEREKNPERNAMILDRENKYRERITKVADLLAANCKTLVVFTPSIFDQTATRSSDPSVGLNDKLADYGKICASTAKKYPNTKLVDMNSEMLKINAIYQKEFGLDKSIIGGDRIHPSYLGGLIMASIFIKDIKEPAEVASVSISGTQAKTFNCEVSEISRGAKKLSFKMREFAMPMSFADAGADAEKLADFNDAFNREILEISDLNEGTYELKIDGDSVGKFAARDFSNGINLSKYSTPQKKASREIEKLFDKIRIGESHLRTIKQVEIGYSGEFSKLEPSAKIALLKNKINSDKLNPTAAYFAREYVSKKPDEPRILKEIAQAKARIRKLAAPIWRAYRIELSK